MRVSSLNRRQLIAGSISTAAATFAIGSTVAQSKPSRLTVVFDAFGKPSALKRGWGYSAFIEYGGRRILFDTGGVAAGFTNNAGALNVDLKRLDFVVLSHRHNDHTAGLNHVLQRNKTVKIYTPLEPAGFNSPTNPALMNMMRRKVENVPQDLQYYGGNPPATSRSDSPWPDANFIHVTQPTEVLPGFHIINTRSARPGTLEMNEVSLLIKTPQGMVVVVGCSHPGIENILDVAVKIDPKIYSVFGGFHLVDIPDPKVTELVMQLRDKYKVERVSAGHCTGQFAFGELLRIYGSKFDVAGVGAVVPLPA